MLIIVFLFRSCSCNAKATELKFWTTNDRQVCTVRVTVLSMFVRDLFCFFSLTKKSIVFFQVFLLTPSLLIFK